jgi:hypothetical protein
MLAVAVLMRRARRGQPGSDPWAAPLPRHPDGADSTSPRPEGAASTSSRPAVAGGEPGPSRAGDLVVAATSRDGDGDAGGPRHHRGGASNAG